VTLKGPVRSDEEKKSVEEKAAQAAGANNVQSQLSVAPPKGKS
jgi:osmotically-inducible protein OsmY